MKKNKWESQHDDGIYKNLSIKYPLKDDFSNEEDYRVELKKHEDFISNWWSGKNKYICDAEWDAIKKMPEERYVELRFKYGSGFDNF